MSENRNVLMIDYVLMAKDVKTHLEQLGFSVRQIDSHTLTMASFKEEVKNQKPAFVFNINFSPEVALICSKSNLPYVSWTIDPLLEARFKIYPQTNLKKCLLFVHQRSLVPRMKKLGLRQVIHMPLAAPANRRAPIEDQEKLAPYRCFLSFVGVSLTDELKLALERFQSWGCAPEDERQICSWLEGFYQVRADNCDFTGFTNNHAQIPGWIIQKFPQASQTLLADALDGWISHILRIRRVQALEPLEIVTWGDEFWKQATNHYVGYADHGEQLTLIYNGSLINLDLPRVYQREIITMRIFDIMASGGLVLAEASGDVSHLFTPGEHLLTYQNTDDLKKIIQSLKKRPEVIRKIAQRGHKEVMAKHLLSHRVKEILSAIRLRGWLAPVQKKISMNSKKRGKKKVRKKR